MFGITMVCTFSPRGLRSLYEVREKEASFTEATKGLLGLKLPPEVCVCGIVAIVKRVWGLVSKRQLLRICQPGFGLVSQVN